MFGVSFVGSSKWLVQDDSCHDSTIDLPCLDVNRESGLPQFDSPISHMGHETGRPGGRPVKELHLNTRVYLFGDHVPALGDASGRVGVTRPVAPVRSTFDEEAVLAITWDSSVPEALVAAECPGGIIAVCDDVVVLLGFLAFDHVDMTVHEDSYWS